MLIDIVEKILAIPYDYQHLNKSMFDLVIDSGYLDSNDQITEDIILEALEKQPARISEWLQWSEDQRVSGGWFLRCDNNVWNIGAFSSKDGYKETLTPYPALKDACAAFIKLQLEFIRALAETNKLKRKKRDKNR